MMGENEILDKIVHLTTHTTRIKADATVKKDHTIFSPLFDACDSDTDSVISREELSTGNQKISDYFHIPKFYQKYYRKFVNKYWHLMDNDNSGSLNFDEYKNTIAGFAMVDAGLILKV